MAGKNNNFSSALLAFLFNRTTGSWGDIFADPSGALSNFYIALHTADPTAAAANQTVNEVAYSGYARVAVPRDNVSFLVTGATVRPLANIDFPICISGSTITATHWSIGTTAAGATSRILYSGAVTPNIAINTGTIPRLTTNSSVTES